jgi:hypothetical protein
MRFTMGFTALCAALLVLAPAALAQGVPEGVYGGLAGDVQEQIGRTGALDVLPFTGIDLALLVGGGLMLLAVGLLARRASRVGS